MENIQSGDASEAGLPASDQQVSSGRGFFDLLMTPLVDRTIAIIAALPFAHIMVVIIKRGELNILLR